MARVLEEGPAPGGLKPIDLAVILGYPAFQDGKYSKGDARLSARYAPWDQRDVTPGQ